MWTILDLQVNRDGNEFFVTLPDFEDLVQSPVVWIPHGSDIEWRLAWGFGEGNPIGHLLFGQACGLLDLLTQQPPGDGERELWMMEACFLSAKGG